MLIGKDCGVSLPINCAEVMPLCYSKSKRSLSELLESQWNVYTVVPFKRLN